MKTRTPGLISEIRIFAAWRLAIIFVVQGAIWGQGAPPSYDFVTNGIREAHVDTANGIPRLIINGQPVPPLLFTYQEDFPNNLQYLAPQVQDAANNGIHLYSVSPNAWPWDNGGTAPLDFSATDQLLDKVIKVDPQAILLLQIGVWPGPGWIPPMAPTSADQILYLDGLANDAYHISMASDIYFNGLLTSLPHLIQHFETSSYAAHLLGYKFCGGNTCEWFPIDMYTRGIDYSPVNTAAFQTWLQNKYGTDAALGTAWGRPVTISSAQVPLAASRSTQSLARIRHRQSKRSTSFPASRIG